jgi:hypothetical protein
MLMLISLYTEREMCPLSLLKGDVAPNNAHLSFVIKAGASLILNKLRCTKKMSVSILPSTELDSRLGDTGASHFTRSEMIACGRDFDLCLLFEFLI